MKGFIQRKITSIINAQKTKFPVLAITEPRQSGKITLLKQLFNDYQYVFLENPDTHSFASEDPVGFLNTYPKGNI